MHFVKSPQSDRLVTAEVAKRQAIEVRIVKKFIKIALADGCTIAVDNGEEEFPPKNNLDEVIKDMFSVDEEHLYVYKDGKYQGKVFLVYGNDGWDVICDYSVSLEKLMPTVNELVDSIADSL